MILFYRKGKFIDLFDLVSESLGDETGAWQKDDNGLVAIFLFVWNLSLMVYF